MKIMTGTIWTNKKKLDMNSQTVKQPWCENCKEEILEHHEHVMGDCKEAMKIRDASWEIIKKSIAAAGI